MPKRFCVNTKGLTKDERQELASSLNDLVQSKKAEFEERRHEPNEHQDSEESQMEESE